MNKGVFLLLGTNQGNRHENLAQARQLITKNAGKILIFSSIYKTAAWGKAEQPDFYNQVIEIETNAAAGELLTKLQQIELEMGRVRIEKWGPRIIDIDILFFGEQIVSTTTLTVPHPGIPERRFTLVPLAEIAPEFQHPLLKLNVRSLLSACKDPLPVERVN
jgi:2-amino-4-hydroxy-6-hydroxymethyldihydropteridine diphosphokinase